MRDAPFFPLSPFFALPILASLFSLPSCTPYNRCSKNSDCGSGICCSAKCIKLGALPGDCSPPKPVTDASHESPPEAEPDRQPIHRPDSLPESSKDVALERHIEESQREPSLGIPERLTEEERDLTPETSKPPSEVLCVPRTEVCDGKDNDCDGFIDEGVCPHLPSFPKELPSIRSLPPKDAQRR